MSPEDNLTEYYDPIKYEHTESVTELQCRLCDDKADRIPVGCMVITWQRKEEAPKSRGLPSFVINMKPDFSYVEMHMWEHKEEPSQEDIEGGFKL